MDLLAKVLVLLGAIIFLVGYMSLWPRWMGLGQAIAAFGAPSLFFLPMALICATYPNKIGGFATLLFYNLLSKMILYFIVYQFGEPDGPDKGNRMNWTPPFYGLFITVILSIVVGLSLGNKG